PSIVCANLNVTCGHPNCTDFNHGMSASGTPSLLGSCTTLMQASTSTCSPPPALGFGSECKKKTSLMPASLEALVHGPVRPVCRHGSSVTTAVAPSVLPAASARAWTSACAPPTGWVAPVPTISPEVEITTAPTGGFGLVVPRTSHPADIAVRNACSTIGATAWSAPGLLSIIQ